MIRLTQLWLDLQAALHGESAEPPRETAVPTQRIQPSARPPLRPPAPIPARESGDDSTPFDLEANRDAELEEQCREMLTRLELSGATRLVRVVWNPRLVSTAGYAAYPQWRIELNPLLKQFEGQVDQTLKHELAHLIAYHRAARRKIEPHGKEWKQACTDLGIHGEKSHHRLPLPRRQVKRNFTYACPSCGTVVHRVRKFRRLTACLPCCKQHNGGNYDRRFQFVLMEPARATSFSAEERSEEA